MWTLAIDTSTTTATVALLQNSETVVEIFVNLGKNHSCVLLPLIEQICKMTNMPIDEIDLFVCTVGPGSFTGIRIGLSTVKGFALATGKPVVGVSTLEALAMNLSGSDFVVCPMLDARKNQIYSALYRTDGNTAPKMMREETVTEINFFLQSINENVIFLGDGAGKYAKTIKDTLVEKAHFTIGINNHIRASMVGLLGEKKLHDGECTDSISLMPKYLRSSDAESKITENYCRLTR
jgi:tRNA threonylcarbamoyladenosine biosynthesis protein TsaB